MMLYEKFRRSSLDTTPVGLVNGPAVSDHICTPIGAKIIAWCSEQNGLHFCHISGLGELVFAVDPLAPPGDCIHPVAENLMQFIGLVCTCGNAALIAGAYRWSKLYFDTQKQSQSPSGKARSVLKALNNIYHPLAVKDPYTCITQLQNTFDYSKIPLHTGYFKQYPVRPGASKWRVSPDIGFSDIPVKSTELKELLVARQFQWQDESWCVPAIYLNENHIIIDSYLKVPVEKIEAFVSKWGNKQDPLTTAEKLTRDLENPLWVPAKGLLTVNNKSASRKKSYVISWNPTTDNAWNVRKVLDHYHLDRNNGYVFMRECFLHKRHPSTIRSIEFTLSDELISVPGQCFFAPDVGKSIAFIHPETHIEHTLTVISQNHEALDPNFLSNHPCFYTKLQYSLVPPIHHDLFQIVDCNPSDPWYGSSQDPTAVFFTDKGSSPEHCAISSLRHVADPNVQWQMIFRQKLRKDIQVRLIP